MYIGKIVKSDSHINYVCQIYGPREVEVEPGPSDYAFGRFVRAAVDGQKAYLHMGYLPHIIAQRNSLLPMVTLRIIDQLERLFPQNSSLLSIVKRNFAWRLKVETTG